MVFEQRVRLQGGSHSTYIDKAICKQLGITENSVVSLEEVDGGFLIKNTGRLQEARKRKVEGVDE